MQLIGSKPGGRLLLFVCLLLSWQVKAQSGFENRIVIQVDGLSVRATVDKPDAKEGETLTLTLAGLTSGATATVTAGPSAGSSGYEVKQVQGKVNAYTLIMPSGVLYIHVKVTNRRRAGYPGTDARYRFRAGIGQLVGRGGTVCYRSG